MKLSAPLLLLASLLSHVSAEAPNDDVVLPVRSHPRDFPIHEDISLETPQLFKRAIPSLPTGSDATKLHIWIRTDKRALTYDNRSGASHEGLNQLMKDTGGRHKDVVIGNPSRGYWQYGLEFQDERALRKPNGDGAAVASYSGAYKEVIRGDEKFEYKGQVRDVRRTLQTIKGVSKYTCFLELRYDIAVGRC